MATISQTALAKEPETTDFLNQNFTVRADSCGLKMMVAIPLIGGIFSAIGKNRIQKDITVVDENSERCSMTNAEWNNPALRAKKSAMFGRCNAIARLKCQDTQASYKTTAIVRNIATVAALVAAVALGLISTFTAFFLCSASIAVDVLSQLTLNFPAELICGDTDEEKVAEIEMNLSPVVKSPISGDSCLVKTLALIPFVGNIVGSIVDSSQTKEKVQAVREQNIEKVDLIVQEQVRYVRLSFVRNILTIATLITLVTTVVFGLLSATIAFEIGCAAIGARLIANLSHTSIQTARKFYEPLAAASV